MNKVEKKRQKEQYVVEEMIRLYCRKNHGKEGHASGGMLQAGNAGKDPRRYAVFGAEDAAVSSDFSYLAFNLQHEREAKSKSIKERYL